MLKKTQHRYADILMACMEEKFFKTEAVWEYHSFMRVISGQMKIVLADQAYLFTAGDTLLVPRNQLSRVIKQPKDGNPYRSILITFRPDQLRGYYAKHDLHFKQPQVQKVRAYDRHPLLDSLFASLMPYFELESALPKEISQLKIEEAISILRAIDKEVDGLLADFSEPGKIDLPEFMEKNFMFNLPLEQFSYLTGRSIATFNRDFRKAFRSTPRKWLIQKRLEFAHYQLSKNDRKPVEIYLEAGFENLSHFSYAFKKQFGYPPTNLPVREIEC